MIKYDNRKDIYDNNKVGKIKITHVCTKCGNLYSELIKLSVNHIAFTKDSNPYQVTTPVIDKVCTCGEKCMQIDNSMGIIYKQFIDKGYKVISCCEGHRYIKDFIPTYTFPEIIISGNIKALIPESYYNKFNIESRFDETVITCKIDTCEFACQYREFKLEMLELLDYMVKSIPNCPFKYDDNNDSISCSCL